MVRKRVSQPDGREIEGVERVESCEMINGG